MSTNDDELIQIEDQDGVHVVRLLSQAILDPVEIDQVEKRLLRLIESAESPNIVVALENVEHVSSLMISTLIKVRQGVSERHGDACLAAVPRRLQDLFDVLKIGDVFNTYDTVDEAVAALRPA